MTFVAPDPVSSGCPYKISRNGAGTPKDLQHFVGDTSFTIENDGVESVVRGTGAADGTGVRFQQKDVEHSGKDVRTWDITEHPVGHFLATPVARC